MAAAIASRSGLMIESHFTENLRGIFHLIYGVSVYKTLTDERLTGVWVLSPATEQVISENTVFFLMKYMIHPIYFPHKYG